MDDLLSAYLEGEADEDTVLRELNQAVHYNAEFSPCMYELFFIQALQRGSVPRSTPFLGALFKNVSREQFLVPDEIDTPGTRSRVLQELRLQKTLQLYQDFLVYTHSEPHTLFRQGVNDTQYQRILQQKPTIHDVHEAMKEELQRGEDDANR